MNSDEDNERAYLSDLNKYYQESHRLLKNHDWMEMTAVKAFLLICGVPFKDEELAGIPQDEQPPDIRFEDASFEVTERLENTRKRGDEVQSMIEKIDKARSIDDVCEAPKSSIPMDFSQLLEEVGKGMDNKYPKYNNPETCGMLDLLVYVNLSGRFLNPKSERCLSPRYSTRAKQQGWRSVSFLTNNCAGVLSCRANAPDFFRDLEGPVIWAKGSVFEG